MSSINPKKLKVVELKKELESRDIEIPKSSKKADLVAMLISAIESEAEQEKNFSSSEAPDDSAASAEDTDDDKASAEQSKPEDPVVAEPESMETSAPVEAKEEEVEPDPKVEEQNIEEPKVEPVQDTIKPEVVPEQQEKVDETQAEVKQEETLSPVKDEVSPQEESSVQMKEETSAPVKDESSSPVKQAEVKVEASNQEAEMEAAPEPVKQKVDAEPTKDETGEENQMETSESKPEENGNQKEEESKDEDMKQDQNRKRRHDERTDRVSRWEDRYAPPEEEPDEDFDDSIVALDVYNCDLNFKVSKDRFGGQPLTVEGFAYLWAGARSTYGVKNGKVFYECKIMEEYSVKHLPSDEPHPHVVRVGWSMDKSSLQLGEEALSYGYGGTGKFSVDCNFTDYGETFREGDVIGCYIDFSSDEDVKMFYTKNGQYLDLAYTEEKSKFEDQALFPHVLCKNTGVEVNFGQKEEPYFPNPTELEDFVFISTVSKEELTRAPKAPETKKECEVLMMCGLPGAGKTYYATQTMKDHPERKYNMLGTNSIMDKMRIMGVSRKKNYAGRWDILIQNSTQCLNRLLQIACRKRRNYILDQTNVYASAQRRKMRPFEGFHRKAVVIVPTEEEFQKRIETRTADEGKEVPDTAVLEMKANFTIPEVGNLFDEVIFTELGQEEAQKLVEKYREEGRKNGPPPEKRSRGGDYRNRPRDGGNWRNQRGFRGGGGGPQMYGNGGPWGGRYMGGPGMGFGRGGYGGPPGFRGRGGGGYGGNRQGGFGRGGGGGGRGDFGRRNDRQNNRGGGGKGWQDYGNRGGGRGSGGYGGYNRQNQGRGGGYQQNRGGSQFQNTSGGGNQRRGNTQNQNQQKFQHGNNRTGQGNTSTQATAPQSAQSYSYGQKNAATQQQHRQQPQQYGQGMTGYGGYNFSQTNTQQRQQGATAQAQQQAYQQAYGQQQDYSQQWAQYYQQQAQQNQQYQNYYASYQQYYGQQATQQQPRQ